LIEFGFNAQDKPTTKWSNVEKQTHMANDKAMNALSLAISQTELSRISNCDSAKDAWDICNAPSSRGRVIVRIFNVFLIK
jgi:hypothetical protein